MKVHIVSAYSINIDHGHHMAKTTIPTWGAKDPNKKVFIMDQNHVKKIARHCPHGPLMAQIGAFFTKLVPSSRPVSSFHPVPSSRPVLSSSLLESSSQRIVSPQLWMDMSCSWTGPLCQERVFR